MLEAIPKVHENNKHYHTEVYLYLSIKLFRTDSPLNFDYVQYSATLLENTVKYWNKGVGWNEMGAYVS